MRVEQDLLPGAREQRVKARRLALLPRLRLALLPRFRLALLRLALLPRFRFALRFRLLTLTLTLTLPRAQAGRLVYQRPRWYQRLP